MTNDLKLFVPSDEVGFTVDLDEHTDFSAHVDIGVYEALVGLAARFFECSGQAFLAQVIDGLLNIVAILSERFLAIEDAGAGFLSQFFDKVT